MNSRDVPLPYRTIEKRMRKVVRCVAGLLTVALITQLGFAGAVGQTASQDEVAKRFIGMWRLVSAPSPLRGQNPTGFIVYDKSGNMAAQIMPDRPRPKFAATQPTPEEAKEALIGYVAYFGTYTVDANAKTVTHHRTGNIHPGAAATVVRRFEFVGDDRVILRPVENENVLTWERVK
jgi:Lipocalin-like domain